MVIMLGLLSTGLAYATWQETLFINGIVETGTLDWEFTAASSLDPGPLPISVPDYHCNDGFTGPPYYWMGDKDVGYTTVEITDPHTVTVTLQNVYPSYFNMITIYAKNTGTIPFIIEKAIIDSTEITSTPAPVVSLDLNDDGLADIEILWKDAPGDQLEPGQDSDEISFWIHVLQDAPEGTTLSLTIEIVAVNWNEYEP